MKFKQLDLNLKIYFILLIISVITGISDIIYLLISKNTNSIYILLLFVFVSLPYIYKYIIQFFNYIKLKKLNRKKDGDDNVNNKTEEQK